MGLDSRQNNMGVPAGNLTLEAADEISADILALSRVQRADHHTAHKEDRRRYSLPTRQQ